MAAGGQSGRLFRETGPGKKVYTFAPSPTTSEGNRGLVVGVEPPAVGCQRIQRSETGRAVG